MRKGEADGGRKEKSQAWKGSGAGEDLTCAAFSGNQAECAEVERKE